MKISSNKNILEENNLKNTFIRCKNCKSIILDILRLEKSGISVISENLYTTLKLEQFSFEEKKLFEDIFIEEKKIECKKCKLKLGDLRKQNKGMKGILANEKIYQESINFCKKNINVILVSQTDLQREEKLRSSIKMINYLKKMNKNFISDIFTDIGSELLSIHDKAEELEKLGY
jgi:hypothetical protein